MLPFYFLTILFNGLTGYILAFCGEEARDEGGFAFSFYNEIFRLVLGALSVFTGLMKLLSPVAGNFPVIGDMLPALANFAGGFILLFEYYRSRTTLGSNAAERIGVFVVKYRKITGFAALSAAALHFVLYPAPFL
jgi:hypothetical protein